ncbi:stromal interaction molecule 1 precursor, partial [Danaus plexippus plexippus]
GSRWKDWLLASLLLGAVVGGWAALRAGRASRHQVQRMLRDMEHLRKAEMALDDMQKELEKARLEQESVTTEKKNLEKKLQEAGDTPMLNSASSDLEVTQLKSEIEMLRAELRRAEGELEDRCWAPPAGLQQWLQLTHEIENKAYLRKKQTADGQLQQARDACEKLRKKRSSLVGAFVSTHGKSIDDVDRAIVEARTALNEVTQELQVHIKIFYSCSKLRASNPLQVALHCGYNIFHTNYLKSMSIEYLILVSNRDTNESSEKKISKIILMCLCRQYLSTDTLGWREDSSGSEADSPHYPLDLRLAEARLQLEERLAQEAREKRMDERKEERARERSLYNDVRKSPTDERKREQVHFILGGDNVNWTGEDLTRASQSQSQPQLRSSIRGAPGVPLPPPRRPGPGPGPTPSHLMERSRSTDHVFDDPRPPPRQPFTRQKALAEGNERTEHTPPEEESTDSSLMEEDGAPKPRKRRIHLPFGKKSKTPA